MPVASSSRARRSAGAPHPPWRTRRKMTLERFMAWKPDDGFKYEWISGFLEKIPYPMDIRQAVIADRLVERFRSTQAFAEGGRLWMETRCRITSAQIRIPDLAYFTPQQIAHGAEGNSVVPAFVVEIISGSDNINRVENKLNEYVLAGVQVVWCLFPETRRIWVLQGNVIQRRTGDEICSAAPALPDFSLTPDELFA